MQRAGSHVNDIDDGKLVVEGRPGQKVADPGMLIGELALGFGLGLLRKTQSGQG